MQLTDPDMLRGILLIALLAGFLGIWAWAWGSKRKPGFHAASLLPLEEDETPESGTPGTQNRSHPC